MKALFAVLLCWSCLASAGQVFFIGSGSYVCESGTNAFTVNAQAAGVQVPAARVILPSGDLELAAFDQAFIVDGVLVDFVSGSSMVQTFVAGFVLAVGFALTGWIYRLIVRASSGSTLTADI